MEKNEISKALKKLLNENGLKSLHVVGERGTAWGWISIRGIYEKDWPVLEKLGIHAHNCGSLTNRLKEWEAILNNIEFRKTETYKKLMEIKEKYLEAARAEGSDGGTCCGGAGTYIVQDGKIVDFWEQIGLSDFPNYNGMKAIELDLAEIGLSARHEAGWMD